MSRYVIAPDSPIVVCLLETMREGYLAYWGYFSTVVLPQPIVLTLAEYGKQPRTCYLSPDPNDWTADQLPWNQPGAFKALPCDPIHKSANKW